MEMRDATRIHRILGLIESYWMQNPDLRFEQLLMNLGLGTSFYKEDNVLLQELRSRMLNLGLDEKIDGNIVALLGITPESEDKRVGYLEFNKETKEFVSKDGDVRYKLRYVYSDPKFTIYEEKDGEYRRLPNKELLRDFMEREDARWLDDIYFEDIEDIWAELIKKIRKGK